jgi:serine phosphatase RsbU (regulator of sigma subunit)
LVFYTDGVTEFENSEGKAFAHKRLQRVFLRLLHSRSAPDLELILNEPVAHSAGRPQTDDITLVVVRVEDAEGDVFRGRLRQRNASRAAR